MCGCHVLIQRQTCLSLCWSLEVDESLTYTQTRTLSPSERRTRTIHECYYLYEEDNEKIEVGYPSELLEQILGDKIPNGVLKEKENNI